jgi:hypothetical protein
MILIDITNELSMKLEMETTGEVRPAPSPIMEINSENAKKLRKERSKYFEEQQLEKRLQELEDKYARQTQEQQQQTLCRGHQKNSRTREEGEGASNRHHGQDDKKTRQQNCTLIIKRSKHRKSRKEMEKRRTKDERNREERTIIRTTRC